MAPRLSPCTHGSPRSGRTRMPPARFAELHNQRTGYAAHPPPTHHPIENLQPELPALDWYGRRGQVRTETCSHRRAWLQPSTTRYRTRRSQLLRDTPCWASLLESDDASKLLPVRSHLVSPRASASRRSVDNVFLHDLKALLAMHGDALMAAGKVVEIWETAPPVAGSITYWAADPTKKLQSTKAPVRPR